MGAIKIEFDTSDFKEELSINIVIRKDGEVVKVETNKDNSTFTALPPDNNESSNQSVSTVDKKTPGRKKKDSKTPSKSLTGNMMGFDF